MALTRVQATGKVSGDFVTSIALTFPSPPTVGNAVIVLTSFRRTGGTVPTCVDNQGHTYTAALYYTSGNLNVGIFYVPTITATGTPFTVTLSSIASDWSAAAVEVSGVGAGLGVDRTATASTASGTAPASGTTAALTAAEVFVAAALSLFVAQASITVQVVSPTWTQEYEELGTILGEGEGDTRILTGVLGTTTACAWTLASSAPTAAGIVAFAVPAASAVATVQPFVWGPL